MPQTYSQHEERQISRRLIETGGYGSTPYGKAWYQIETMIDAADWTKRTYQGKVDATEYIPFAEISEQYGLSNRQYEALIRKAQKVVDSKLKAWLDTLSENERISFRTGIPLAHLEKREA